MEVGFKENDSFISSQLKYFANFKIKITSIKHCVCMTENIESPFICQLYEYDADSFLLTKNTPEYFAKHFASTELLDDKNHWLNYHSLDYQDDIEMLCASLSIDRTTFEDIYTNYKRARLEEYDNYLYIKIKSALPMFNSSRLEEENISFISNA